MGAYVNCNISEGLSSADINSYKWSCAVTETIWIFTNAHDCSQSDYDCSQMIVFYKDHGKFMAVWSDHERSRSFIVVHTVHQRLWTFNERKTIF